MQVNQIKLFNDSRQQIRAYLTFLLERNIPTGLPSISFDTIEIGIESILRECDFIEGIYVLDGKGVQITRTMTPNFSVLKEDDQGMNRSNRTYYYKAVRERRAILTDPYPSLLTNQLCVSASLPVYDESGRLEYVIVIDVSLKNIVKIVFPNALGRFSVTFSRITYALFSIALLGVVFLLMTKGLLALVSHGFMPGQIDLKYIFESTILLTLGLAIFDLVKTIFEEEVLGREKQANSMQNRTMSRFIGSIIIALAIEALMLVFKFAITDASKLLNAVYLIGGVSLLIVSLALYFRFTATRNKG